jgi:DNA invertase Pin-like site-specific DNA recombinase
MTVINEYCDRAISGKTDNRPGFQRLIKDSDKGQFDAVIMYTLDRFARNRYDSAIYKAKLKKNGVRVYYAKQPMPDTPEGIILESVLEGYAEYYSENLSRNIKRGMKENAMQCRFNGSGKALGYTVGKDGKFEIDPMGARIVNEIFQLYADGTSINQIINYCNENGYKTSLGNSFNKNSLRTILNNEKYIGVYKYADVIIPDGMPVIIDKVLFDKVQATFKHNSTARAKNKAKEDLLTTKLFCGHCGSSMVGESGTSKSGKLHFYYKCVDRKRKRKCKKAVEKKDWIEELVVRFTVQKVLTDENIDLIATRAMEIIEKESADTTFLDGLQAQLKEVKKKLKNLMTAIEQGMITSTTKERLEELELEKNDIETQIAREEIKKPLLTKERIMYWLVSFKSGDINDVDYRRRVIDTLVNSVYVYDDGEKGRRIVFTFNISGQNTATISCSDIACSAPP